MVQPKWSPDPETLREMLADMHRMNSGLPITDLEAVHILTYMAVGLSVTECPLPDCESCETTHRLFWELSNGIGREARVAYQRKLRVMGCPLPPSPVDETPIQ